MTRFSVLLLTLFALPAGAFDDCKLLTATAPKYTVMNPRLNKVLCFNTATATASDSGILDVSACSSFSLFFDPSYGTANTDAEGQLYRCSTPVGTPSTVLCDKMLVDTDGDGVPNDVTLDGTTGRDGQVNQTAAWIWLDMTAAPGAAQFARALVVCH